MKVLLVMHAKGSHYLKDFSSILLLKYDWLFLNPATAIGSEIVRGSPLLFHISSTIATFGINPKVE